MTSSLHLRVPGSENIHTVGYHATRSGLNTERSFPLELTHWGLHKIADVLKIFFTALAWLDISVFWLQFHISLTQITFPLMASRRTDKALSELMMIHFTDAEIRHHRCMITSSALRSSVTGPSCGEFTSHRWIPLKKASYAELWYFFIICAWTNSWVNNRDAGDLRRHRANYDVIAMRDCIQNFSEIPKQDHMFWVVLDASR